MTTFHPASSTSRRFKSVLTTAVLIGSLGLAFSADAPKSLLPAFAAEGAEFTTKAKDGHTLRGWLPTGWNDNTEWASVTATYTKLTDTPDKAVGALRVKVEKVDEGQLQLTSYSGKRKYAKGTKYTVTGWVRSPDGLSVNLGARQVNDPYEFYHEQELSTEKEWKRFEFSFTPAMDFEAFIMFVVREAGTVDLAGVAMTEGSK